jgi:hypothetical protein
MAVTRSDLHARQAPAVLDEGSPLLDGGMFASMWNLAEAMAKAKTVPDHLRGSPGDCLRVVELAQRCRQSPFALADHSYLTGGKLALDGQAMMALINAHPKIDGSLDYRYEGQGEKRSVRVVGRVGRLRGEAREREVLVTLAQGLADSKGARARWERDADQMLAYYGARKWARRHAPEVTMGLYTPDELEAGIGGGGTPMRDVTPPAEEAAPAAAASPRREVEDALSRGAPTASPPDDPDDPLRINGLSPREAVGTLQWTIEETETAAEADRLWAIYKPRLLAAAERSPKLAEVVAKLDALVADRITGAGAAPDAGEEGEEEAA